jgi:hypothetical protein
MPVLHDLLPVSLPCPTELKFLGSFGAAIFFQRKKKILRRFMPVKDSDLLSLKEQKTLVASLQHFYNSEGQ